MSIKLTIGMATHTDFDGVYMTVNNLRHNHNLTDCEIVVVDNNPDSEQGQKTAGFLSQVKEIPCRYHTCDIPGTTQSRNAIFDHAEGEAVLVMDSHVFVIPNAIENLKYYYLAHPETNNLLTGPVYYDNLTSWSTHFFPFWRGQMWGIWALAWMSPDGKTVQTFDNRGVLNLLDMQGNRVDFPNIPWAGHEAQLKALGYHPRGFRDDTPFEIPAHGLGLFSCRKSAWLGFNKEFREFGGEECYIHEKYRQAGHTTMCLPFLGWQHRWYKAGPRYGFSTLNKFRNYVLGFKELNLAPCIEHFKKEGLTQAQIDLVLADPKAYHPTSKPTDGGVLSRIDLYHKVKEQKRDLNEHADFLQFISGRVETIVELTCRRESTVFLLSGNPSHLISFQEENDPLLEQLKSILSTEVNNRKKISWTLYPTNHNNLQSIPECELLFLDTRHTYERLKKELTTYSPKVSKYIVIHDTHVFADRGEDGKEGLSLAITEFIKENPEWYILYHTNHQYGLTTLSKVAELKPATPVNPFSPGYGVGTELKKILAKFGIEATPNCACNKRAKDMDSNGIAWCEQNIGLIVSWLKEEHTRRQYKLPFSHILTTMLVKLAIRKAKRNAP